MIHLAFQKAEGGTANIKRGESTTAKVAFWPKFLQSSNSWQTPVEEWAWKAAESSGNTGGGSTDGGNTSGGTSGDGTNNNNTGSGDGNK